DHNLSARPLGAASRWWLDQSLRALDGRLKTHGAKLIVQQGNALTILKKLSEQINVKTIYCGQTFEPVCEAFDASFEAKTGIGLKAFNTRLLAEPGDVLTGDQQIYRVFTPFYRALVARGFTEGVKVKALPAHWPAPSQWPHSLNIDELNLQPALTPSGHNWAEGFDIWTPGEVGAHQRLRSFIEDGLKGYEPGRDRPDLDLTSHLSPHLRFGEISPHRILYELQRAAETQVWLQPGLEKFRSELAWRDFSYNILKLKPNLHVENVKPQFDAMPWRDDPKGLRNWQKGQTGYGLVDAGMRELWQTGYMHNRVRMVCASFLTKHLLIDWRLGEQWFWDTLVDADPASNPASWQWVAGSGADAAPYFRIFNPLTQAEKFDPKALYRRKYISGFSENYGLTSTKPRQKFEQDLLDFAGIDVNADAPSGGMIVDHSFARQRALDAYAQLKTSD
ncbi:MAG: deoxyribodipyrimidine photo-lyase, partial [Asticcacaulis sp.]